MELIDSGKSNWWGFILEGNTEERQSNALLLYGFGRYRTYYLKKQWLKSKEIMEDGYKYPVISVPSLEMVLSLDKPNSFSMGYSHETHLGSSLNKDGYKCFCFLPWTIRRRVKQEVLDWDTMETVMSTDGIAVFPEDDIPDKYKKTFSIKDTHNDIELTAKCYIYRDTWAKGTGKFKWLTYFTKDIKATYISIRYSTEVGKGKGSWKGGIVSQHLIVEDGNVMQTLEKSLKENGLELLWK